MTSDPDRADENGAVEAIGLMDELACTNRALRRAARQLGHLYDEAMAPAELKATQFGLLVQIDRSGGHDGPTLQALAERLAIRISAMTHALRPLVRDGLVELRPDAHDGRTKHAAVDGPPDASGSRLRARFGRRRTTAWKPFSDRIRLECCAYWRIGWPPRSSVRRTTAGRPLEAGPAATAARVAPVVQDANMRPAVWARRGNLAPTLPVRLT